jgi:chromosome segregation ATPase
MIPVDVVFTSAIGLILVAVSIGAAVFIIARARWVGAERKVAEAEYRRLGAELTGARGEAAFLERMLAQTKAQCEANHAFAEGLKSQVESLEAENRRRADRIAYLDTVVRQLRDEAVELRDRIEEAEGRVQRSEARERTNYESWKAAHEAAHKATCEAEEAHEECCRLRQELSMLQSEGRTANEIFQVRCNEMRAQWKAEGERVAQGMQREISRLTEQLKMADRRVAEAQRLRAIAINEAEQARNRANRITNEAAEEAYRVAREAKAEERARWLALVRPLADRVSAAHHELRAAVDLLDKADEATEADGEDEDLVLIEGPDEANRARAEAVERMRARPVFKGKPTIGEVQPSAHEAVNFEDSKAAEGVYATGHHEEA